MTTSFSDIELIVYNWLTKRSIPFESQVSLRGGVFELGGAKVDFLLPESGVALRVHGEYWHTGVTPEGRDAVQREILASEGWTVVDCWGRDLKERTDETMEKALLGFEMLQ